MSGDPRDEEIRLYGWSDETMDATRTFVPSGASAVPSPAIKFGDRYNDLGLIGRGGMGEVRRVYDRELDRTVAMKVLGMALIDNETARARFTLEAGITAGLQHPGIVPVHQRGELPDGRLWFTMREVRGRTLARVIASVHGVSTVGRWGPTPDGWTLRRLAEALMRVCEAVSFSHREGIIHRDIKPQNIMVGAFGEVQVMDWGLAVRISASPETTLGVERGLTASAVESTAGQIVGTPAYMPPEQARGDSELDATADVYSLGAVLYEILTGQPPFVGTAQSVWRTTIEGPPRPVRKRVRPEHPPLPDELVSICERAMARETGGRFPEAGAMAAALRDWLEGARRREQAEALVAAAAELRPRARALRQRARALDLKARAALGALPFHAPLSARYDAWALQDEAATVEREASLAEITWEQRVRSALTQVPELESANAQLADYYRERVEEAEGINDSDAVTRYETLLRLHDRGRHAAFLEGTGWLSVQTDVPAQAVLYRFAPVHRRLVPQLVRDLGQTPVTEVRIPRGSYLVELQAPGRATVRYPVFIERGAHWDGVVPGGQQRPIRMPASSALGPGEIYVPAGWFSAGGDPDALEALSARQVWVDGFVVRRWPVTRREYLIFINELIEAGRVDEIRALVPRAGFGMGGDNAEQGRVFFRQRPDGTYDLGAPGEDGYEGPDLPVTRVSWHGAMAYARWMADRTGLPWRLPNELEWEKAARGIDRRWFPWGNDDTGPWAAVLGALKGTPEPVPVDRFSTDESPYGVQGMAGNVRDWCINLWEHDGPPLVEGRLQIAPARSSDPGLRSVRGGGWATYMRYARLATRFADKAEVRFPVIGFRLARPFDLEDI